MKRIFFYANVRTYDFTVGITRKVFEQIEAFKKLGLKVYYSGYTEDGVAIFDENHKIIKKKLFYCKNDKINHILRRYMLLYLCCDFVKEQKFEVAYLRYHFFDSLYIKLLRLLKQNGATVIIEAHSYPVFPKGFSLNPIKILDDIYSKSAKKYCDLIAAMTNFKIMWEIPTYEIENTLDPKTFKLKEYRKLDKEFVMINVAFENITHGLDRIIKGIYSYKEKNNKMKIKLYLIGEYRTETHKLVKDLKLEENILFLGKKQKEEINQYMDEAHFALGSLGNHRANSFYGSALKTKEYIARGIPSVYGWEERILKDFPYALKVELNEEVIDIDKIIEFYKNIGDENLNIKIREYLLQNNSSWQEQYSNMLEEVKKIGVKK